MRLQLRLFGVPSVTWAGATLRPATRKSLAVLAYLASHRGGALRSEVAELLWTRNATAALRQELYRLRALPGAERWLIVGAETLDLEADSDHQAFMRAVERGDDEAAVALVDAAPDALFLRGVEVRRAPAFDEWRAVERSRIDQLVRDLLERVAEAARLRGELGTAERYAERLLDLDGTVEGAYRTLMHVALERGDLRAGQRVFERCVRTLARELGTGPTAQTLDLGRAITRSLELPSVTLTMASIPAALLRPPTLVGRETAWSRLESAWRSGRMVFLSGPPGIGKTRLAMDFVEAVAPGDYALLRGRPSDASMPYATLARGVRVVRAQRQEFERAVPRWALELLNRFLPHLLPNGTHRTEGRATASMQPSVGLEAALDRYVEAMFRSVDAYIADDLQYFDEASFQVAGSVLQRLVRALDGAFGFSINVYRDDELPTPWRQGIDAAVAMGVAERIELEPIPRAAVTALVEGLGLGVTWSESLLDALYERSGGSPLYLLELLRSLAERGRLGDAHLRPSDLRLSERIRSSLANRLAARPATTLRVARALAVLGDDADLRLLTVLSGVDADGASAALAELAAAHVVHGMSFTHDLHREALLEGLGPRRRTLEAAVGNALARVRAPPHRVAERFLAAGDRVRAANWYIVAAERALAEGLPEVARLWLARTESLSGLPEDVRDRVAQLVLETAL